LAISGVPPFAGFFSKEEILLAAFNSNKIVYGIALFTSGLTAFYMFRLYFSIFWKKTPDSQLTTHDSHHEGTFSMKLPLIILALGSLLVGFIPFGKYVSSDGKILESPFHLNFSIAPVLFALTGILLAMWMYKKESDHPQKFATALGGLYQSAYKKFYIDEIYLFVTKKIIFNLIGRPAAWIDKNIVDGTMNGIASATATISGWIKGIQSGKVQSYALYFFGGIIVLAIVILYLWK
jgi:NADH-quinone oxidoreductase subunit L